MNFSTIAWWELKNSLKSRKFLLIFFLQFSVLFMLIIMFNSFSSSIESQESLTISPSLTDFVTMDVDDSGGLFLDLLNPELVKIQQSTLNNSLTRINNQETSGFYFVSSDSLVRIKQGESVETVLYLDYSDPKRSVIRDAVNTANQAMASGLTNSYLQEVDPQNLTAKTDFTEEKIGESIHLKLINKFMLVVLLFIPLFLFGNMIIDSLVGEKERKTGEILIAMPISVGEIIWGKSLAVVAIMALQIALWILVLLAAGFIIKNVIGIYLLLVLTSLPIVGLTTIIAAYSKNYKEAGIGLSFTYIFIVGFLIIPALFYISQNSLASNISPMTTAMRLFSGETISILDMMIPLIFILLSSAITFWIAIRIFQRDEVVFGPRPGPLTLSLKILGIKK